MTPFNAFPKSFALSHLVINYASSLRSKRFRGVWEQKKTRKGIFGVLPAHTSTE